MNYPQCERAGLYGGLHAVASVHDFACLVYFIKAYAPGERELIPVQVHMPVSRDGLVEACAA